MAKHFQETSTESTINKIQSCPSFFKKTCPIWLLAPKGGDFNNLQSVGTLGLCHTFQVLNSLGSFLYKSLVLDVVKPIVLNVWIFFVEMSDVCQPAALRLTFPWQALWCLLVLQSRLYGKFAN